MSIRLHNTFLDLIDVRLIPLYADGIREMGDQYLPWVAQLESS